MCFIPNVLAASDARPDDSRENDGGAPFCPPVSFLETGLGPVRPVVVDWCAPVDLAAALHFYAAKARYAFANYLQL
jgi:hypothetical protein